MKNPRTLFSTLLCALGLALSIYLALLKFYSLPCVGPGNCHAVIHSGYGTVLRLPVGVYGALIWIAVIFVPDREKRTALLGLLSLGAVGFMGIQFFVLHSWCAYCTAHAVVCWSAFALNAHAPRRWGVLLGLAFAAAGFLGTRQYVAARANLMPAAGDPRAPLATAPSGVAWLGRLSPTSPALVVSLDCAACLDLLEELSRRDYSGTVYGPAIFFKTTEENEALTLEFVAGVLASRNDRRDAFLAASALLLAHKDNAVSAPKIFAAELAATFHGSPQVREEARLLLEAQHATLSTYKGMNTTPLLVLPSGHTRAFFRVEDLFPR